MEETAKRSIRWSWLCLVLSGVIVACGGSGTADPKPAPDAARAVTPDASGAKVDGNVSDGSLADASVEPNPDVPPSSGATIKFHLCPGNVTQTHLRECGSLSVPEDYSKPAGRRVDIEVTRIKANDPLNRIGVLFVNPGGPGIRGDDFPSIIRDTPGTDRVARFDLIGFNPRGVGKNTFASCDYTVEPPGRGDPNDPGFDKWLKDLDAACVKKYGAEGLALFSTRTTARDMDEIRKALGEEQISYLGFSYGTWLGPTYAQEFPDRVRAMVIDATMLPESNDLLLLGRESAQATERALAELARTCKADPKCPLAGMDVIALIDRLLAKAALKPIPSGVAKLDISPDDILEVSRGFLDAPNMWGFPVNFLAALADIADHGLDGASTDSKVFMKGFLKLYGVEPTPDGGAPSSEPPDNSHEAIVCADFASRPSLTAFIDNIQVVKKTAPHFFSWAYDGMPCVYLPPATDAVKIATLPNPKKVLVVGAWTDSNTLYEWSERLAKSLGGTYHLRYDGAGHGSFLHGYPCVDDTVGSFLTELKGPIATTCPATAPDFRKPLVTSHEKSDFSPVAVRSRPGSKISIQTGGPLGVQVVISPDRRR